MSTEQLKARISHDLTNHAPAGEDVLRRFGRLRIAAKQLGYAHQDDLPAPTANAPERT